VLRIDADTGVVISKYEARELVKFAPLPSDQNEERVRVQFTTEKFDIAS
jgi:hypothetical protein